MPARRVALWGQCGEGERGRSIGEPKAKSGARLQRERGRLEEFPGALPDFTTSPSDPVIENILSVGFVRTAGLRASPVFPLHGYGPKRCMRILTRCTRSLSCIA